MSLPSLVAVIRESNIDVNTATTEQKEKLLFEAMKRDIPEALEYLHQKAHRADDNGGSMDWMEDPKSPLGQQLIRIHASDAFRPIVSKYSCHGKQLTFVNCCKGVIGTPPADILLLQIQTQNGDIAKPDC